MSRKRLTGIMRREQIVDAARRIFSQNGFHGTTTRRLASEAGISEALLFKHFPSKAAVYKAILALCLKSRSWSTAHKLLELAPSTATLAVILHFIAAKVLNTDDELRSTHRLMLRSLSEDGDFARILFKHIGSRWIAKMRACIRAASKTGDIPASAAPIKDGPWFAQHVLISLAFMHTPEQAAVRYTSPRNALVEQAVVFCLRALGFDNKAIARNYNPRMLKVLSIENENE